MNVPARILLCLSLMVPAAGVSAEPRMRSAYLEPGTATSTTVATYAQETGLSLEEARLALAREDLATPHVGALSEEFKDRLAGLFWARLPAQHIVVRLTGDGPVAPRNIQTEAGVVPVTFVTGAAATRAQLSRALSVARPQLRKMVPGLAGTWLDETTGRAVLDVDAPATCQAVYDDERASIEKAVGFPIEFRFIPAPRDLSGSPAPPAVDVKKGCNSTPSSSAAK